MPGWGCQSQFLLACLAPAREDPAVPVQRGSQVTAHSEQSSQTGLEHDCLNEHSRAVTGHQVGSQRMGGKAIAAGGCGSQHSLFRHLWAS